MTMIIQSSVAAATAIVRYDLIQNKSLHQTGYARFLLVAIPPVCLSVF